MVPSLTCPKPCLAVAVDLRPGGRFLCAAFTVDADGDAYTVAPASMVPLIGRFAPTCGLFGLSLPSHSSSSVRPTTCAHLGSLNSALTSGVSQLGSSATDDRVKPNQP
jgi:hypothetical protein